MNIKQLIQDQFPVQYVYSYPTTRSYEPVSDFSITDVDFTQDINIYIHIPFCDQKCSFCGYLTVIERLQTKRDMYVDALVKEIYSFAPYTKDKIVRSINFGGGTPSLLSQKQVEKIMNALKKVFPNFLDTATEISMEATPESIEYEKIQHLKTLGFNRMSIGIQTLHGVEIVKTGRHNSSTTSINAMKILRHSGIDNLCVDLMYGLPLQTEQTWQSTVRGILEFQPETIELYRTVIIPGTRLSRAENPTNLIEWKKKSLEYSFARDILMNKGYAQDFHVRFVIPKKGFYDQQSNVFKGQSLVGFGVGARTYADNVHYRNTYSTKYSKTAIDRYVEAVNMDQPCVESAIFLTNQEKGRRHAIYNLESLDVHYLLKTYGLDISTEIVQSGLFTKNGNVFSLKPSEWYHRDLVAYSLFSEKNLELEKKYYGEFLKDW